MSYLSRSAAAPKTVGRLHHSRTEEALAVSDDRPLPPRGFGCQTDLGVATRRTDGRGRALHYYFDMHGILTSGLLGMFHYLA